MAGGKETPRQKMIGMMYLVLTALLALNVTKEVVTAFVTINDKLDASAEIIDAKIQDDFATFNLKKMSLISKSANMDEFNFWKGRADQLNEETNELIHYLLSECNDMIREAEGEDWVKDKDEKGNILKLKPLKDIKVKDNYDVPTHMFIGSNPSSPNERGSEIRNKIHNFRNSITEKMGTYKDPADGKEWSFIAPQDSSGLKQALETVNPDDRGKIAHFYRSLTIPSTLYDAGEEKDMPWVAVAFDHTPIVAAAALFASLKLDVKNASSLASEYFLAKIDETPYYVNKIEPTVIAKSGYINQGESLDLKVLVAAYDTNEVYQLRWGIDADTLEERWKESTGLIPLSGQSTGQHKVKGAIGIRERNNLVWKPWEFDYTVGEPMGAISLPKMRVLYRGLPNEIEAAASGYPQDKISISASSGCHIVESNGKWNVNVERGVRKATLTIKATKEDGSIVNIAQNDFEVRPLPKPQIFLGGISNGQTPSRSGVTAARQIRLDYDESVLITGVKFKILKGMVTVEGLRNKGKILADGRLDSDAISILRQSSGKQVTITCDYRDPSGEQKRAYPLIFKTR